MQKLQTVFRKSYTNGNQIHNEINKGCEWVLKGEGTPTLKYDGSCCLIRDGKLYKRFDRKLNKAAYQLRKSGYNGPWKLEQFKQTPDGWEPCEREPNKYTGHWPGWMPVGDGPEDKWHREAFGIGNGQFDDGTYELVGPKVQENPYNLKTHLLWRHGREEVHDLEDRSFEGLKDWLENHDEEGLVFHHPDGRKSKIRRKDFGLSWNN